jgi:hypothetical protein
MPGNISMLGENAGRIGGAGGAPPIFAGNGGGGMTSVGGTPGPQGAPMMQQQGNPAQAMMQSMEMQKLMREMKAAREAKGPGDGSSGLSSLMGGKKGGGMANPSGAQDSANAMGMMGGGM